MATDTAFRSTVQRELRRSREASHACSRLQCARSIDKRGSMRARAARSDSAAAAGAYVATVLSIGQGLPHATVRRVCARLTVLAVCVAPAAARAGGFTAARFGGEQGTEADVLPSALDNHPGAIGLLDGQHLMLEVG